MNLEGFKKRGISVIISSMPVLFALFLLGPVVISAQQGERPPFLWNLSKIRQPGQPLQFSVHDTATYFGLSDAEKVDLLNFSRAVWTERVTETNGITLNEYRSLRAFLSNAFQDTLRNYSWTDKEKKTLSHFKQLYNDTKRMNEDTPEGRELRESWAQRVEGARLAEEAIATNPGLWDNTPILQSDSLINFKALGIESSVFGEKPVRLRDYSAWVRANLTSIDEDGKYKHPWVFRGLSEAEKADLVSFLETVFADTDPSRALTDREQVWLSNFLGKAFSDPRRNYGWTEDEKKKLEVFKKMYSDPNHFLKEPAMWDEVLKRRADRAERLRLIKEGREEKLRWTTAQDRAKGLDIPPALAPGQTVNYTNPAFYHGALDLGDTSFYIGLSTAEKLEITELMRTLGTDTTRTPEANNLKRKLSDFLTVAFADSARNYGWTPEERARLERFKEVAANLNLLQFNTPEKRKRILQQTE